MTRLRWGVAFALALTIYAALVWQLGSESVTPALRFTRTALAVAIAFVYLPALRTLFLHQPPPGRDYLIAGIVATWLSVVFAMLWNELSDALAFTDQVRRSVAGVFGLLMAGGALFHVLAAAKSGRPRLAIAVVVGVLAAAALVFGRYLI